MGCIIKGDMKYGDKDANEDGSICLHARRLKFIHPVKKEPLTIEAPPPSSGYWKDFATLDF
jgi:23S rRNA pseudouridine1911/1915/1917 synthase